MRMPASWFGSLKTGPPNTRSWRDQSVPDGELPLVVLKLNTKEQITCYKSRLTKISPYKVDPADVGKPILIVYLAAELVSAGIGFADCGRTIAAERDQGLPEGDLQVQLALAPHLSGGEIRHQAESLPQQRFRFRNARPPEGLLSGLQPVWNGALGQPASVK
jgi:hypothetical protein